MATKVIVWKREYYKYIGPLNRQMDKLFKEYNKHVSEKGITDTLKQNELWREKFRERYEKLDKRIDQTINKLWLRYHESTGSTKARPGYKIIR